MSQLPEFEGRSVRKASLRITKAGDGLSDALTVAPKAYHHGEEIALVLKVRVTQVNHKPEKSDDPDLVRVHTAEALDVVEVDESDIAEFLSKAGEFRRRRAEQETGQTNLLDAEPKDEPTPPMSVEQAEEHPVREPEPFSVA